MAEHSFTVEIAVPPEWAYDIWVDPRRSLEWTEGMNVVSDITGPPGRAGTRFRAGFGRAVGTVEVLVGERPSRYLTRVELGPLRAEFDSRFEATATGTRMTETVRTRGLLGWFWNRILSTGGYKGSFRGELLVFAGICERDWKARSTPAE
jgi:hypothetical protein